MKPMPTVQEIETKVVSLYKYSYLSILIHLVVAGFFIFTVWFSIPFDMIIKWLSILVGSLLVSVLCFTLFNSKRAKGKVDFTLWENYLTAALVVNSVVFGLAYAYAIIASDASLYPILAFIFAMHLSCILMPSVNSKKLMLSITFALLMPCLSALIFVSPPIANVLAIALSAFVCILLTLNTIINNMLNAGFKDDGKYAQALELVEKYKVKLANTSIEDPQTQILNRRFFDLISSEEIRRAKRASNSLSLALIEIDCFDEYFQHYGQEKSAKLLRTVAKLLTDAAPRGGEYMMRFDEKQFILIAPNIKTSEAIAFTTKIMDVVCNAELEHKATMVEHWDTVSISIGIAEYKPGDLIGVEALIDQASYALKTAIEAGRNNTKLFAINADDNCGDDEDASHESNYGSLASNVNIA